LQDVKKHQEHIKIIFPKSNLQFSFSLKVEFSFVTKFPKIKIIQDLISPTNHLKLQKISKACPNCSKKIKNDFIEFLKLK
jgi:hypothetical protein